MCPAQFAVLVTPARGNHPSPRADRQSLVARRIVSTLTTIYACWFEFCPDPYLATSDNGYILGFIVLQAGSKWQEALVRARDRETLSFALMVVACESLKPEGQQFQEHNIYDVVEGLLGKSTAEPLKADWFRPQNVRSVHLHRGEFLSSEFVQVEIMSSYHDPTFDQARRALAQITQEAIIEWLRRRGVFTMAPVERKKTFRRWIRENALVILPALTVLGVALGWFLRTLSYR